MQALVLSQPGRVALMQQPEPTLEQPGDVIVRVTLAGLCGSDLHIVSGRDKGCAMGTTMGHELVGVVESVGSAVTTLAVGDRVIAPFTVNCGECFFCQRQLYARCARSLGFGFVDERGQGLQGAQAEWVRVPFADATLIKVPDAHADGSPVADADVLFLGDILSTAYGCLENGRIVAGDVVAVVGCGPVGLLCVHAAKLFQPVQIIAVDPVAERRQIAKTLADNVTVCDPQSAADVVAQATSGRGADVVAEAVGHGEALTLGIELLRPGGTVSIAGYHTADQFPLPIQQAYGKNMTLVIGRGNARKHMQTLLPLVMQKQLQHQSIITDTLPLSAGVDAYERFASRTGGTIKVVLQPGS